jgi:hypothetical protein
LAFRRLRELKFLAAACLLALLVAQAMVLAHQLDFDAHEPGHACETCLVASTLGSANVAHADFSPSIALPRRVDGEAQQLLDLASPRAFRARAPPLAS